MLTSDDKVGGWVKKGQNHDDVILEWSIMGLFAPDQPERKQMYHCIREAMILLS
jgi:hypothetical protein